MYSVGEYVVYGNSGICEITDITELDSQKGKLYYLLIPIGEKGTKIYSAVNRNNAEMRRVLTGEEASSLIDEIPFIEELEGMNERGRDARCREIIRGCDCRELVSMIKTLYARKKKRQSEGKKSTSTDDKYFKMAEHNLYSELAFAMGEEEENIQSIIKARVERQGKH